MKWGLVIVAVVVSTFVTYRMVDNWITGEIIEALESKHTPTASPGRWSGVPTAQPVLSDVALREEVLDMSTMGRESWIAHLELGWYRYLHWYVGVVAGVVVWVCLAWWERRRRRKTASFPRQD